MKKLTLDTKVKLGDKFIDKYKGSKKEDKPLKKSILKKEEQKKSVADWDEWRNAGAGRYGYAGEKRILK